MNKTKHLNHINLQNQRFSLSKPSFDDLFIRTKATLSDLHTLVKRKLPSLLNIEVQSISNVDPSDKDPISMILWLKHSFIILLQSKEDNNQGQLQNYESMLQKLQNDVRQHIRQQMKIYNDSIQVKLQQSNKHIEYLQQQNNLLKNKINNNSINKSRQRYREQRQSLGKSKKVVNTLKIRDKSNDLKKSIAKTDVTQRVRKMKQQACGIGLGSFRPSLTKLCKRI